MSRRSATVSGQALDERGFALVSVLIICSLIALLTLSFSTFVRGIASDSAKFSSDIRIRSLAEAGLNRMILAYAQTGDPLRTALFPDGRPVPWSFGGAKLTLRVQAESGKLDVNAADRPHIAALASRVFENPDQQGRFLNTLDAARTSGGRIDSIASLLGPFDRMTATRDVAEQHFTVTTNQRGFDMLTAPALVIRTMPALPETLADRIIASRTEGQPPPMEQLPPSLAQRLVTERPIYTFRADVTLDTGRVGAMRAIVGYSERGEISIYSWTVTSPALN